MQNSIFQDVFETDPLGRQALFQSHIPRGFDRTLSQQQQWGNLFDTFFNKYLGQLGGEVRGGTGIPSTSFTSYLENLDFGREARRLPSSMTGRSASPLTSTARFLYNR